MDAGAEVPQVDDGSVKVGAASFQVPGGAAHLDQLIRQTRVHHVQLSMIADQKAAMLLTVASVVMTLTTHYLQDDRFRWPAALLLAFCLATVCLATFAVLPKLAFKRGRAREAAQPAMQNRLFFGYFTNLSYEQFLTEMSEVMASPSATYEAQLREIYELGLYLRSSKYRFVQLGYATFLTGLLLSTGLWIYEAFS